MAINNDEATILAHLSNFYKDWLIWASEGACNVQPFSRHDGLCMAIQCWVHYKELSGMLICDLKSYMKDDFRKEELDTIYPFGELQWDKDSEAGTMHTCPKRFAFVYKMAKRSI